MPSFQRLVLGITFRSLLLTKGTDKEKQQRSRAIQEALKQAALLPLEVARHCLVVMELRKTAVTLGNPNALSMRQS
ncbi:MAG: cyclodeaminase/cyclohydrolase family protein [Bacillota bacterium]